MSIVISQAIFSATAQKRFIEADTVQAIQRDEKFSRKCPFVSLIIQLTASVTPLFTQAKFDEIAVHRIKNMMGCRYCYRRLHKAVDGMEPIGPAVVSRRK